MAHFIEVHQLTLDHMGNNCYTPILFNLDTIISIESSTNCKHSIITTRWTNNNNIRIKETLSEILILSNGLKKSVMYG
jgi:hypothetical protein